MIGLIVQINDETPVVAAGEAISFLCCMLHIMDFSNAANSSNETKSKPEIVISTSGRTGDDAETEWVRLEPLYLGDEIRIRMAEVSVIDVSQRTWSRLVPQSDPIPSKGFVALEVTFGDGRIVSVGGDELAMLTLEVSARGKLGPLSRMRPGESWPHSDRYGVRAFFTAGTRYDEQGVSYLWKWPSHKLQLGEELSVRVIETTNPDPPSEKIDTRQVK